MILLLPALAAECDRALLLRNPLAGVMPSSEA